MKLDNQTWSKITSKSPPNFDRRKKTQWDQNTNHPNVTSAILLMEEWNTVNLESAYRQMKKQMPQPQDTPGLKDAQDFLNLITKASRANICQWSWDTSVTPMQTRRVAQQVARQKANRLIYWYKWLPHGATSQRPGRRRSISWPSSKQSTGLSSTFFAKGLHDC